MPQPQMRPDADIVLKAAQEAEETFTPVSKTDPNYPVLHLAPPVGRLNDPNGLIFKDGVYHAFYQYAPTHPARDIFWRHASSTDLVRWEDGPNAIAPTHWYDRNGAYSGSAYEAEDGTVELFYSGNVKNPDGSRETYQNLVTTRDFVTYERYESNPLISGTPEGFTPHFRDPSVYKRDGKYYALIGTQRENLTGAIVLYSSSDRRAWNYEGEVEFSDPAIATYGYMLECPQVFSLQDRATGQIKDVLIFCPQGMAPVGEKYNNKYQSGYVVGHLKGTRFEVETPFTEFDAGFEFYAPQVFHGTADGYRALITAWFGISDQDDMPTWDHHWLHMFNLPRWLTLNRGLLVQTPAEGLNEALPLAEAELGEGGVLEPLTNQRVYRLAGTVDVSRGPVTVSWQDAAGQAVTFTLGAEQAVLDRSGSLYTIWGPVRTHTFAETATERSFDLLFDASSLEIFIDGGKVTMSGRVFMREGERAVSITGADGASAARQVTNLWVSVLGVA
ncbi:glycoside hydrolase family 32 protein [Rothia nasisuis]|uniref:glycoside hydrolase family 32 protein n=1 Tax=Rothia nasisuis TaxID=2109647 RepID=UPI001F46C6B2|nr:glycoside hydrolase family 32 protein [Rothia nasisuis]